MTTTAAVLGCLLFAAVGYFAVAIARSARHRVSMTVAWCVAAICGLWIAVVGYGMASAWVAS